MALVPLASGAVDRTVAGAIDRASYIRANVAILRTLPLPPHGRLLSQRSDPQYTGFDPPGEIKGYLTKRYYTAPKGGISWKSVDRFFLRRLKGKWTWRANATHARVYRRGRAMLVVQGCGCRGAAFALLLDYKAYAR
jgi:hypothetical protein